MRCRRRSRTDSPCRHGPTAGPAVDAPARRRAASAPSPPPGAAAARPATLHAFRSCAWSLSSLLLRGRWWLARGRGIDKDRAGSSGSDKCVGIRMDSLITAAARALAAGDPLGALNRVALRDDAPALALRGIAMAQLGDFDRAKALLKRAGRAFGAKETVARARCVV